MSGHKSGCGFSGCKRFLLVLLVFLAVVAKSQPVYALGISPTYVEAGTLNIGEAYSFSFELVDRFTYPTPLNVTFELTETSGYLYPNVMFSPQSISLGTEETRVNFSVIIFGTEDIASGSHLLIFRPAAMLLSTPEVNSSYNITAASQIITTPAAGINFTIPVSNPPPQQPSQGGSSGGGGAGTPPEQKKESPEKNKGIAITIPSFFKVAQQNETLVIKIKNTGDSEITDLAINITSTPPFNMEYIRYIGALFAGEEKYIYVNMSGFSGAYNYLNISVSDGYDEWSASSIIYVPEIPRSSVDMDCILFEPKNITVTAKIKAQFDITASNICNISLHNVNMIISGLDYKANINHLEPYGDSVISPLYIRQENKGRYDYVVSFVYDEGKSVGILRVYSVANLRQTVFIAAVMILILYMLFFVMKKAKPGHVPKAHAYREGKINKHHRFSA